MRKMKDYAKPFLRIELFHPQDYVAMCEYYMDGIDHYNGAEITSSTKFWPDSNQDGIINGNDYDHQATSQTDGAGWIYENDKIVKAWWAESNKVAKAIYENHSLFEQYQRDKQAGYVDAVYVPKNDHYHAGTITMRKNQS